MQKENPQDPMEEESSAANESENKAEEDGPTEEEILAQLKAVSPIGGLFPKWDRKNQSVPKILLYCFLALIVFIIIGYFGSR